MPLVSFDTLAVGQRYSRPQLAKTWGYRGYAAIARGVVTPRGQDVIVLFVTRDKQQGAEPYRDWLENGVLYWEGPTDHFAEDRMLRGEDEIHLFYREIHHAEFLYCGRLTTVGVQLSKRRSSLFVFKLRDLRTASV